MPKNKSWYEIKAVDSGIAEVYIYDEIGYWGISAKDFISDVKSLKSVGQISLHINSPGGEVFDGVAIYNYLKNHSAEVVAYVDGIAASMASVILMAADKVVMPDNALIMIHNPIGGAYGEAKDLAKTADLLNKVKQNLISAYASKMSVSEDEISKIMDEETYLSASEALEFGLIDEVVDSIELAANFDLSRLNNAPENILSRFGKESKTPEEKPTKVESISTASRQARDLNQPKPEVHDMPDKPTEDPRADFKAQEKERQNQVANVFSNFPDQVELKNTCMLDLDCTASDAQTKLLNVIGKESKPQEGGFTGSYIDNGKADKDAMNIVLLNRSGIVSNASDLKDAGQYQSMSLMDMARASLHTKGIGTASYNRLSLVGAAFTHSSSDFGYLLMDVANKSMLKGYEEAEETFQRWTQKGTLSDFKTSHRVGLDSFPALEKVPEGGEYNYATVKDRGEQIALATYGRLFSISRQAIINDDLSAFTVMPRKMGAAAIRTVGNLVYALLVSNPNMADGNPLFSATRKNLATGANSAMSITALDAGRTAMARQKDSTGTTLNIRAAHLLVPVTLEGTAKQIMNSTADPDGKHNQVSNKVYGMAEVIPEARLDEDSLTRWYLTPGSAHDSIEVAYLDGNDQPFMEQTEGFTVDGASMKVRIDAGVAPLDAKTIYRSDGA